MVPVSLWNYQVYHNYGFPWEQWLNFYLLFIFYSELDSVAYCTKKTTQPRKALNPQRKKETLSAESLTIFDCKPKKDMNTIACTLVNCWLSVNF